MMLTNRQEKLLKIFLFENTYVSVENLAKKLTVSERTIYSEINRLSSQGYKFVTKRGKGYKLENDAKEPDEKFINQVNQNVTHDRRLEIMSDLLFNKKIVTLNNLSETYFVSPSSIKNDLKFIENIIFKNVDLNLISDHDGTRIGDINLANKINILFNFNQYVMDYVHTENMHKTSNRIDILSRYYNPEVIKVCKNIIYSFIRTNNTIIPEVYVESLLSIFISLVSELCSGRHFETNISPLDMKQHAIYISNAVTLLHKASLRLNFRYENSDVEFLSQMLLNYRFEPTSFDSFDDQLITRIIKNVSDALEIDLTNDNNLFNQLKIHVPPMIYRLKLHTRVKNPFTDQIKLEFSITYNCVWIVLQNLSRELEVDFNEDEIAFLTIYFQLSIEKIEKIRKILIVCQTGIVTSELLINRIKKSAPSLDIIDVASINEMKELDLNEYDFVLTTLDTGLIHEKIQYVSPFIKSEELVKLLNFSSEEIILDNDNLVNEDINFLPVINQNFRSKDYLLTEICETLVNKGFVSEKFYQSLLDREQLGSTEFPLGVALPHGKPEYVKKTVVVFIQNIKKIKWNNSFVDSVFLIAISKEDIKNTRKIISSIYKIINNEILMKSIKEAHTEEEVKVILYGRK